MVLPVKADFKADFLGALKEINVCLLILSRLCSSVDLFPHLIVLEEKY